MILLLQGGKSGPDSQVPFQPDGGADKPSSEKLGRSGQMPVSRTPMMTSSAYSELGHRPNESAKPRK